MSTKQFFIQGQLISSVQKEGTQITRMKTLVSVDFTATVNTNKEPNFCLEEME